MGFLNGLLVEVARIDSCIATLGSRTFVYAIALWHPGGRQAVGALPPEFHALSTTFILGLPITAFYVLAITVALWVALDYTPVGRDLQAIGANQRVAELNGIPTRKSVIGAFVASGLLTALAGVLLASKLRIGQASVGLEFLLPALAGTILGAMGRSAFAQSAFDGPTTGPEAAEGKTIVVLAADLKNGGILGVTNGIEEAAAKIGWTVKVLDGAGSVQSRSAAVRQALALNP